MILYYFLLTAHLMQHEAGVPVAGGGVGSKFLFDEIVLKLCTTVTVGTVNIYSPVADYDFIRRVVV